MLLLLGMNQEELLNKILIKLVNVAEDVNGVRENMFTKNAAQEMESRLMSHIDSFIKLHEAVTLELVAMRSKHERLEERIQKIELKLGIATV